MSVCDAFLRYRRGSVTALRTICLRDRTLLWIVRRARVHVDPNALRNHCSLDLGVASEQDGRQCTWEAAMKAS